MATRYVRGVNGNDGNAGTSYAAAFATLFTAINASANGDTILCSELERGSSCEFTKSNLTIGQDPQGTQYRFKGGTVIPNASWATTGTANVYDLTGHLIATGLTVDAVLYDWDNLINARGSHYGTMTKLASAAAVNAANSGTAGCFFYNSATGNITAYFGGANPITSGKITEYVARSNVSALKIIGTGNTVSGLWFECHHNSIQGGCVWLEDATSSGMISGCVSYDCGPHAFIFYGALALIANCVIDSCSSYGAKVDASHFTFFQTNGLGSTSALRWRNCHVERHNWLNLDGNPVVSGVCAQTGFYCHSNAGTPMADVESVGCSSYDQQVCNAPIVDAGGNAAPGTPGLWSSYTVRCDQGSFLNMCRWGVTSHIAVRRTRHNLATMGSSGLCRYGGNGCIYTVQNGLNIHVESSLIEFNSNDAGQSPLGIANATTSTLTFVNCSIIDQATDGTTSSNMFYINTASGIVTVKGCALGFAQLTGGGSTQKLEYADAGTSANFVLDDNLYGLFSVYANNGTIQIANAAALALYDTHSQIKAAQIYAAATDLHLTTANMLLRRATASPVPAFGYDSAYDRHFGAYQFIDMGSRARGAADSQRLSRSR